jgi:hypothetical protein
MMTDTDLPFESADNDNLHVSWFVLDPEYDRLPEVDPWVSHDWTMDYDNDEDFE